MSNKANSLRSIDKYSENMTTYFNQATKEFKRDQVLLEHKMSVTGVCETKEGKMISVGQDKKMIVWRRIKCA